ncbi:hypothetical protein GA0115240_142915, partial [Streptomyces sp. DvalAA-14]
PVPAEPVVHDLGIVQPPRLADRHRPDRPGGPPEPPERR